MLSKLDEQDPQKGDCQTLPRQGFPKDVFISRKQEAANAVVQVKTRGQDCEKLECHRLGSYYTSLVTHLTWN
ncbi:hypothetical protein STEG23_012829 [Scotinomys teguina]